jgi:hypothetical protein
MHLGVPSSKDLRKARLIAQKTRVTVACTRCKIAKQRCSDHRPSKRCCNAKKLCTDEDSREQSRKVQELEQAALSRPFSSQYNSTQTSIANSNSDNQTSENADKSSFTRSLASNPLPPSMRQYLPLHFTYPNFPEIRSPVMVPPVDVPYSISSIHSQTHTLLSLPFASTFPDEHRLLVARNAAMEAAILFPHI